MMYQSTDSNPSVDVKIKDELEIGPTVLQQSFSHQNDLENQINDSCSIKLEEIKDCFEFEYQESVSDFREVYFKSELDNLDYKDVKTVAATQPPTYQVGQQEPGRATVGSPDCDSKLFSGALADEGSRHDADCPSTSKDKLTCTNARQFSCQICSARFKYVSVLKIHERQHSNEKSIECEICKKSFTSLGDLKSHKCTDTGEKSHHCKICNESFTSLYTLQLHKRIHTGEKPRQCQKCKKRFTSADQLSSHKCIRIVYAVEKIHYCKICSQRFTKLSDLKSHQREHITDRPYHCEICNQSFTTISNMVRHSNIHVARNIFTKYKCSQYIYSGTCSISSNNLSSLNSHYVIGDDDRPSYNCEKCGVGYVRPGDLTRHMRTKHFSDIRQGLSFYPHLRNINKDLIP